MSIASVIATLPLKCGVSSNEPLSGHCTIRVGGPAEVFATPDDVASLVGLAVHCRQAGIPFRVIGRGSNLLPADAGFAGVVISTARLGGLRIDGWSVQAEAGVPLPRLVSETVRAGLGGIEYLASVPGNVGGGIFMNAGRGAAHQMSISDHVEAVTVFDGQDIRELDRRACRFAYRSSVFQENPGWTLLGARLRLPEQSAAMGLEKVKERLDFTRAHQDTRFSNFGTVYRTGYRDLPGMRGLRVGGACFSERSSNWIVNDQGATAKDVADLIDLGIRRHNDAGLTPPDPEVRFL